MQPADDPVLVLDPAMLPDPASAPEDDSDYEYEYHDHETETFYLTLDLASNQNPSRPRRRQDSQSATAAGSTPADPSHGDGNEPALASTEIDSTPEERVQILGLHTHNPIVSYRNQIFNCTWADQIGTELLFAHPEVELESEHAAPTNPLRRGKDFDLIAANSVKILGRKANLISSAGPAPPTQSSSTDAAASDADPATARKTGPVSNQARFLERLRSIKQAKGETDTIRSSFSLRRTQNLEDRLRGWAQTDEQLADIQRLNEAAIQGSATAMADLENLCIQLGSQDPELSGEPSQQR